MLIGPVIQQVKSNMMILNILYILHEYVAKKVWPYYLLKYESREAANRLVEILINEETVFYNADNINYSRNTRTFI